MILVLSEMVKLKFSLGCIGGIIVAKLKKKKVIFFDDFAGPTS